MPSSPDADGINRRESGQNPYINDSFQLEVDGP